MADGGASTSNSSNGSLTPGSSTVAQDDPICIVGMACHLPGGIRSPSNLWDFLVKNASAQGPVPAERFDIRGFNGPSSRRGAMASNGGYFLQRDVRQFDNSFFGISNIEATYMDPQQRKLLEVTFECFENAGVPLDSISGSNTGVFVGNFTIDHQTMQMRDLDSIHRYTATGSGTTILANRLSHVFNLQGPSFTLDTACSSSIYCLHTAVNAIKAGDCDTAIVASVNLITSPEQFLATSKAGVLSPTSACHTFDSSADGYGRAEAVNCIYLKRFKAAKSNGDKIWAIIRGTAVNSNGKTPGITQPNAEQQKIVIEKAFRNANLHPEDIDYIECHGTGTPVGDPIEVDAISRCFSPRYGSPLYIGSVKTNLGHSEAASGLTSIIKIALSFENDLIPPTHGVDKINPQLKLKEHNFEVIIQTRSWPRASRRAGLNSFGYGGANAHVILESVDSFMPQETSSPHQSLARDSDPILCFPVTATSTKSLEARVSQICQIIPSCNQASLEGLAYSLMSRVSQFDARKMIIARSNFALTPKAQVIEVVGHASEGEKALKIAYVFTGQGAQYVAMGKELILHQQVFQDTIRSLDATLQTLSSPPSWTIEDALLGTRDAGDIHSPTLSQSVCTAIQLALVDLLRSWNLMPSAVVGHSSGEIAAAYAAGILSAKQSIMTAYFRGLSVNSITAEGAMLAVGLSVSSAEQLIEGKGLSEEICIACINAPENVTLSGSVTAINILDQEIRKEGIFSRKLNTGGRAYHSPMMGAIAEQYEKLLRPLLDERSDEGPCTISEMYSSVGLRPGIMDATRNVQSAKYWRNNLENPVDFLSAVTRLMQAGPVHLLEIGPHSLLKGPIQQIRASLNLNEDSVPYTPTLLRGKDAYFCMKRLAASLWLRGYILQSNGINTFDYNWRSHFHNLPPYPWDYSAALGYHEPRVSSELRHRRYLRHPLLGSQSSGGSSSDRTWRNSLQLNELPWLADHRVNGQIVFPAAAYMTMAMEGLQQMKSADTFMPSFEFRNVAINAALSVEETDSLTDCIELNTTLSPKRLSVTTTSASWYDFTIMSSKGNGRTTNCVGSIRRIQSSDTEERALIEKCTSPIRENIGRWYDAFKTDGLQYGVHFQSITSLSLGTRPVATGYCSIKPDTADNEECEYAIHPITIDACLQMGIFSSALGNVRSLRAHLPVFIEECRIFPQNCNGLVMQEEESRGVLSAHSSKTSLSTQRIQCVLENTTGETIVSFKGVKMVIYTGMSASSMFDETGDFQRHPCLQVKWKPDIHKLHTGLSDSLSDYIDIFRSHQTVNIQDDERLAIVGGLIDLVGHRDPKSWVIELGEVCDCKANHLLKLLDVGSAFPRLAAWKTGILAEDGTITIQNKTPMDPFSNELFDVLIIPNLESSESLWSRSGSRLISLLHEDGVVVTRKTLASQKCLKRAGFELIEGPRSFVLAKRPLLEKRSEDITAITIVVHNPSSSITSLANAIATYLEHKLGINNVPIIPLAQVASSHLTIKTICISLIEAESALLTKMGQQDMDLVRQITDNVHNLIWITGSKYIVSPDPDLTLVNGLARALMLEQPALSFTILDIGPITQLSPSDVQFTCRNLDTILHSMREASDKEYVQRNGMLHISRIYPDQDLNMLFQKRYEVPGLIHMSPLDAVKPVELSLGRTGGMDTLHFQQLRKLPACSILPEGLVDIDIKAISLNAKDVYTLRGRVETRTGTTAMEFAGIVSATGANTDLQPGDRVVAVAPINFATSTRVPAWAVHKLLPDEPFGTIVSLPIAYCTALYALNDRAHLRAQETILIHSGAGAFGFAAITTAQRLGATVYTTVGSSAKREFLTETLGIPPSNIFSSRDDSFVAGINAATNGKGVDVVINSLTGDLLHASWECIANFGRFVEVGKRDLVDSGRLDMSIFLRNATFTAFDMSDLFFHETSFYRNILARKMEEVLQLYRSGHIRQAPVTKFDIANVAQAYRYFSAPDRIGKIIVTIEHPKSVIPVVFSKYFSVFSSEKVYLLVGCLGGLGRSLSRWMVERGARNLVFLGKSGDDKPAAKELITDLRNHGVHVIVVRGDVTVAEDTDEAARRCRDTGKPLGGVIQGAMGLDESLFSQMSNEAWAKAVRPKVVGTWNLHNALLSTDTDFLLLMSSVSGSVGTATESNYCAANAFLDAFARWRTAQGKRTISLGLGMVSEVGYLHENPEIESLLLRRGIQSLNEDEFLQVIDLALSGNDGIARSSDVLEAAHILTGLEPSRVLELKSQGFDVSHSIMQDPRTAILRASMEAKLRAGQTTDKTLRTTSPAEEIPWMNELPPRLKSLFVPLMDASSSEAAIMRLVRKRFSDMILLRTDQIDDSKPLAKYGVDSMIGSEFRTWIWATFQVDVPLLDIMSQDKTLQTIVAFIDQRLTRAL